MDEPYRLVTKEAAAALLSVSLRTINTLIENGTLPLPKPIPGCRRLYWHPADFRRWQDSYFNGEAENAVSTPAAAPLPTSVTTHRKRGRPRNTLRH